MAESFEGWAILELMGHRRLAGLISEQTIGGAAFVRIDVPKGEKPADGVDENVATQFYAPAAVYCITPVTEELARKVAAGCQPAPVTKWDLPAERSLPAGRLPEDDDEDDDNGSDEQYEEPF